MPAGAKACPECGSDEQTGWSEEAETGGLDLPGDEFDYDRFVKEEFGSKSPMPTGIHWGWWLVAVILVVLFLLYWF